MRFSSDAVQMHVKTATEAAPWEVRAMHFTQRPSELIQKQHRATFIWTRFPQTCYLLLLLGHDWWAAGAKRLTKLRFLTKMLFETHQNWQSLWNKICNDVPRRNCAPNLTICCSIKREPNWTKLVSLSCPGETKWQEWPNGRRFGNSRIEGDASENWFYALDDNVISKFQNQIFNAKKFRSVQVNANRYALKVEN